MPVQILATKLSFPPLRSKLVDRLRLFQKLEQGLDCGFVLISAPAGYGKSTLTSAWLSRVRISTTWLSLDDGDNDPIRFLVYLAAALSKIQPTLWESLENQLQSHPLPDVEILLTSLINQLAQVKSPFWLVLDDYHVIQNQVVHQAVGFLLEHRPAPLHLVIVTRSDPPLPVARLRARSQMVELRMADLRFSNQEAEEFLNHIIGLSLSSEELTLLQTNTEGWAAGLQMAGLSLQGREDAGSFIRSFSGENRYILDFLFEEVFQRQSEDIQRFLLQTAILEQLSGPLCDQVTERTNSQEILESLGRRNLFLIALDEHRRWYRYHNLFSDLLKSRLKQTTPDTLALLHQRASIWFAAQHDLEHAIVHALAAQDFERVACMIEQNIQHLDKQNQQHMLTTWTHHLPNEILENHPWLCVYRAWGDYWSGQRGTEESWLLMAEKSIEQHFEGRDAERRQIQGHIAGVRAHIAIEDENIPLILEMAQKALDLLPEDDEIICETAIALGAGYWALGDVIQAERAFRMSKVIALEKRHPMMVAGATCYSGIQQVKQGRLHDAFDTFQHGLRLSTLPNGTETSIAGFPNVKIGDLWREWNDLARAEPYLTQGVKQCVQFGQPDVLTDAYVCLGRYQLAVGDLEGVQETIQKADRLAQQTKKIDPFALCWLDELRLKTWLVEHNLDAATRWVQNSGLRLDEPFRYIHDLPHQNLARVLVAQGVLGDSSSARNEADSLLTRLAIAAKQAGWVHEEIKILLMQAVNDDARGESETALQNLCRAVTLAEPGSYIRIFVDEGEIISRLLVLLASDLQNTRLRPYISNLLAAFEKTARPTIPGASHPVITEPVRNIPAGKSTLTQRLVEPLSEREMDVLALLAQGCADKQIADKLVIARETVHKHLKNLYGKLDVHSRTAAIARARELRLL